MNKYIIARGGFMSEYIKRYWKTVDLHFHTHNGIDNRGKTDKCNYSHQEFYDRRKDGEIQIQAVTNHNTFILGDHLAQSLICDKLHISYIPGVEIDCKLKDKQKIFHCVFLIGPKTDIVTFSNRLNKKTKEKKVTGSVTYNEDEIGDVFENTHFIYIFHGTKERGLSANAKDAESDKENIDWVCSAISNGLAEPVLFENTKPGCPYRLSNRFRDFTDNEKVLQLVEQEVTTSDNKFDSDINRLNAWKKRQKFAIFAEPTYEGLELSVRNYSTRFSLVKEIIEPVSFIQSINFEKRKDKVFHLNGTIDLSPSLNVIIGNSGTGKTLLLNQIYFSLTGNNLDVSSNKKDKIVKGESIYSGKIGQKKFLSLKYYNNQKPVVVEIAKIYQTLLKASDETSVAELFGVNNTKSADSILSDYITRIRQFSEKYIKMLINFDLGNDCIITIKNSAQFLNQNKKEEIQYDLELKVKDTQKLEKIKDKINFLYNSFDDNSVDLWMEKIKKLLTNNYSALIDNFEASYKQIKEALKEEYEIAYKEYRDIKIDFVITDHINDAIERYHSKLGNKTATILKYEKNVKQQTKELGLLLEKVIQNEVQLKKIDLSYPFELIKKAINNSNSNEYARITDTFVESNHKFSLDNSLFTFEGNKTKLQNIKFKAFSLDDNCKVQEFVCQLIRNGISFDLLVFPNVKYSTELFVDGDWKNITEINPGSIAKIYMDYYFKKIIEEQKPNVVFVDQPENDVDKSFISKTLADFIVKNKTKTQFIITSHEPILAVNSDVNKIIEAYLSDDGAICYRSYGLESKPTDVHKHTGVDSVAEILDGGKGNVVKRNQIYGGTLNE